MGVDQDVIAIRGLRRAVESAGLMACVWYDTMAHLAAMTGWYGWTSYGGHNGLIEVPLSDAREMLRQAEKELADKVAQALS